jgi:hypothetical protein
LRLKGRIDLTIFHISFIGSSQYCANLSLKIKEVER